MRCIKIIIAAFVIGLPLASSQVSALSESFDGGGNAASEYQPPTQNPQDGAASNLQTSKPSLQPIPGQAGINSQDLPMMSGLKVETASGTSGSTAPVVQSAVSQKQDNTAAGWVVVGVLALAVGYVILKRQKLGPTAEQPETAGPPLTALKSARQKKTPPKKRRKPATKKKPRRS